MRARVFVTLKQGVLDPQGKAVANGLASLGYEEVDSVRQGKVFDVELKETDEEKAKARLDEMCRKLLANTVIEDYAVMMIDHTELER